jgi:hypothetical protein
MADEKRNTMIAKVKRTFTSLLPVSKKRYGQCIRCGQCCKLPYTCSALRYDSEGKSFCAKYKYRMPNCRKYPRAESEFITQDTCGFRFR